MIIVPEIETVVILVPRTGSGALRNAVMKRYPKSMLLYRHMEADGVPAGYDRWRKVGVCRHPAERLWSLYKFLENFPGSKDPNNNEQAHIDAMKASVKMPFSDWIVRNMVTFTTAHGTSSAYFRPFFARLHARPENFVSQFDYLRPDLGTEVFRFETDLGLLFSELNLEWTTANATDNRPCPPISAEARRHIRAFCRWELESGNYSLNPYRVREYA